ncbi:cell division protein SepF [Olsenella sp. HMSC062G07]|uniref:cell division protein SepF n=1 Tax=Olsenella sp. HMSC062G07 TaxID=1739330 RepID=UPI0008A4047A|nr:cell division protein SepF [Olsenella sp. HMSC062G07]OFK24903.1 cell division inhibitor SepF [Olsenella sp. HMSC062G07]
MGFLDNIRDRLRPRDDDFYDDDDYYGDGYEDEGAAYTGRDLDGHETSGVLGNTRRPEAESVSVYTRSGRPVDGAATAAAQRSYRPSRRDYADERRARQVERDRGGYATRERDAREGDYRDEYDRDDIDASSSHDSLLGNTTGGRTPADIGLKPIPRQSTSGKLPPYVIKPASYDDVQMVVRRVRTGQPVVLAFKNTNIETAKRVLDFCFGLSCGLGGAVEELGDRVFVVLPQGIELSDQDVDKLVQDGTIER